MSEREAMRAGESMREGEEWGRLPGEPAKWYSRFEQYLRIGPERGVRMTYLKVRQQRDGPLASQWTPSAGSYTSWVNAARTWKWSERAERWDEHNRQQLAQRNQQRRIDERETRIQIIAQQLRVADAALLAAQLDRLGVEEARGLLPTLRLLLRDMLDQHRVNLEPLPSYDDKRPEQEVIPFTADELAAANRELAQSHSWGLGTEGSHAKRPA